MSNMQVGQDWQKTLGQLREQYVNRSLSRLSEIEGIINVLEQTPEDANIVRQLMHHFHWLTGSGSIYGFSDISKLGVDGEQRCNEILKDNRRTTDQEILNFKSLLNAVRQQFAQVETTTPQSQETISPPERPAVRPTAVVVIDPDQSDLLTFTRILEAEGLAVKTARTSASGIELIEECMPDGLIVSIPLPDGSGYELVEKLRGMPGGESPCVLIVSKLTGFVDKVRAIHCGADGYFEKPVDWDPMVEKLTFLLKRKKAEPYRVLSVEDDPDQAVFIRTVLESAGYQVMVCNHPKHFESSLVTFKPDLILLDVILPGVNGYQLAKYVRQDERYATLPVVFLTTQSQLDAQIQAAKAGGDEHLVKPVHPALLLSTVASRLERSRFLQSLLHRDGLTRLLTHSAFMERAQALIAQRKRHPGRYAAMMMIDLDHFHQVNNKYGHQSGDKVLIALSKLLRQRLRQSDIIGRYGGEEFVIIAEDLEEAEAVKLAERLQETFSALKHIAPDGTAFHTTFSVGIAMLDPVKMDLEKWQLAADQALYRAKSAGRNCVVTACDIKLP